MSLSVRPPQLPDESLVGYLLRLTVRNGYSNLSDWLPLQIVNNINHGALSCTSHARLERLIGSEVKHQTILFQANLSPLFISPILESPRICPSCVIENGYLAHHWQHVGNLYCDKHHSLLEDSCQCCSESLIWDHNLLAGKCTNNACFSSLKSRKAPVELSNLGEQAIFDCYLAARFDSSPETYFLHKTKHLHVDHLISTIDKGISFLSSKGEIENWFNQLHPNAKDKLLYPKDFRVYPAELLLNSLKCQWPIQSLLTSLINDLSTPTYRKDVTPRPIALTSATLSNKLKLSAVELKQLMSIVEPAYRNKKIISPIYPVSFSKLIIRLSRHSINIANSQSIHTLSENNDELRFHLLKQVLSGTIPFYYLPSDNLLSSLHICP